MITSSSRPRRIRIPHVIDVVLVSEPEHIKRIEATGDVDRLHRYDTASLPWWLRLYFSATKFHDEERDLWFLPFESAADPSYKPRLAYLHQKVSTGYTQADVQRVALLLQANARSEEHTSELQSRLHLVCRLLLEKKKNKTKK